MPRCSIASEGLGVLTRLTTQETLSRRRDERRAQTAAVTFTLILVAEKIADELPLRITRAKQRLALPERVISPETAASDFVPGRAMYGTYALSRRKDIKYGYDAISTSTWLEDGWQRSRLHRV
jgi:hypothetical protein